MDTPLYFAVQAGFVLLTAVCIAIFVREIRNGAMRSSLPETLKKKLMARITGTTFIWAVFVTTWSVTGKMSDFSIFPFNFMPVILAPIIMLFILLNSQGMPEILRHIPPENLIRLQSFRFFVEILLWMLFISKLLPVQMTFEGRNFDILAGITAPVIAIMAHRGKIARAGIVVWNLLCLALLLNIVITAILSTPSPWRVFMNEPANYIVTYFPVSLLPGFLVPLAYYLHVLSLRQQGEPVNNPTRRP